jgi:hypothetical protein
LGGSNASRLKVGCLRGILLSLSSSESELESDSEDELESESEHIDSESEQSDSDNSEFSDSVFTGLDEDSEREDFISATIEATLLGLKLNLDRGLAKIEGVKGGSRGIEVRCDETSFLGSILSKREVNILTVELGE